MKTGFDCSGFVGFLFRKEAGLELPRSTRELINLDAPVVKRNELEPGDVVFFNNRGRGRVSHAGIYIGDDQFIHASSSRSGGGARRQSGRQVLARQLHGSQARAGTGFELTPHTAHR